MAPAVAKNLASLGVVMIGADTWELEVIPLEKNAGFFEVHQILIVLSGTTFLTAESAEFAESFLFLCVLSALSG